MGKVGTFLQHSHARRMRILQMSWSEEAAGAKKTDFAPNVRSKLHCEERPMYWRNDTQIEHHNLIESKDMCEEQS